MPRRKRPVPLKRMSEQKRVAAILAGLDEEYPNATCELVHQDAFQLLVATILSAQCTDKRVNLVTPTLFARFPTPATLAEAEPKQLEDIIRSTGFFRNKTRSLIAMSRALVEQHGGAVPRDLHALVKLPGVARKTANVVTGTAFGIAAGVVVDTHVMRLAQRLALTRHEEPQKIEQDLMKRIPRDKWILFGHQVIWHGRRVCFARSPNCAGCQLAPYCPAAFMVGS